MGRVSHDLDARPGRWEELFSAHFNHTDPQLLTTFLEEVSPDGLPRIPELSLEMGKKPGPEGQGTCLVTAGMRSQKYSLYVPHAQAYPLWHQAWSLRLSFSPGPRPSYSAYYTTAD